MKCPHCEAEIDGSGMLCPLCGGELRPEANANPRSRPWTRRLLWIGLALLVLIGSLAASAYFGLRYGERDREQQRQAILEEHYQAGIEALNTGRYELARANFQYVLTLEPDHGLAQEGLVEAQTQLQVKPTPTSEAEHSLVQDLWQQTQAAYEEEDWPTTATTLQQLRALDPEYKKEEIETLLFTSLYNAGQAMLAEDNLERGIFYLDQAIALRPLEGDVVRKRNLAARYLAAMGYWGVDWEQAITELEELYTTAPDYKDVFARLFQANVAHGDAFVEEGEMCPAELAYAQALRLMQDATVEQKRTEAAEACLLATPVPREGGQTVLTPEAIPGFNVGRLAYPVYNATTDSYDLYALYANGRILRVAQRADQPWWEWETGRVIYRDRVNDAISMVLPEEGVPQTLTAPNGRAWPTLSPDGQRMAYAAQDANGGWTVYVVNTYGSAEPRRIGPGWAPAWGPTGLLAYTGCETSDEEVCGIVVDNPDDDQPGTRLTGPTSTRRSTPGGR